MANNIICFVGILNASIYITDKLTITVSVSFSFSQKSPRTKVELMTLHYTKSRLILKTGVPLIMGCGIVVSSFTLKSRTFHAWDLLIVLSHGYDNC